MSEQLERLNVGAISKIEFFCLTKITIPIIFASLLFYLFEFPRFFYEYSFWLIFVGTILMGLIFVFPILNYIKYQRKVKR